MFGAPVTTHALSQPEIAPALGWILQVHRSTFNLQLAADLNLDILRPQIKSFNLHISSSN
jgi:hypothetical protein